MVGIEKCFPSDFFRDSFEFEHDPARFHDSDVALVSALTFSHSSLGRFLGNGFIGKNSNVEFADFLHRSSNGNTSRLDLPRRDVSRLKTLQAKVSEGDFIATFGHSLGAALLLLAEFCTFRS